MSDSKKKNNDKIQNMEQMELFTSSGASFEDNLDIFGEHKTRQQLKAEEKARKKAERESLKKEMKKRSQSAETKGTKATRGDIIAVTAVLVSIVLLCGLALGNSLLRSKDDRQWEHDESRGYILKTDYNPEISAAGPKADVLEVYFTNNNHLYVEIAIRNGTDKPVRIDTIDVVVSDDATGDQIAAGKVELQEELIIPVMDIVYYPVYVAPEHLFVDKDTPLPEVCAFDFNFGFTSIVTE